MPIHALLSMTIVHMRIIDNVYNFSGGLEKRLKNKLFMKQYDLEYGKVDCIFKALHSNCKKVELKCILCTSIGL